MAYKVVRHDGVFGAGEIPGIPDVVDVQESGGIRVIAYSQKTTIITALQALGFSATSPAGVDPIIGDAIVVLFGGGDTWVKNFVDQGYVVMVQYPLPTALSIKVVATKLPESVAYYASAEGGMVIVDGPTGVVDAAVALKGGAGIPASVPPSTSGGCPFGYVLNLDTNQCDPPEKGATQYPGETTVITDITTKTPTWVWPVVIGGIALVLVGAAVVSRPQRSSAYGMNRRKPYWPMSKKDFVSAQRKKGYTKREAEYQYLDYKAIVGGHYLRGKIVRNSAYGMNRRKPYWPMSKKDFVSAQRKKGYTKREAEYQYLDYKAIVGGHYLRGKIVRNSAYGMNLKSRKAMDQGDYVRLLMSKGHSKEFAKDQYKHYRKRFRKHGHASTGMYLKKWASKRV